jgi:hypothetical protein
MAEGSHSRLRRGVQATPDQPGKHAMRILELARHHMHGDDVEAWQEFLATQGLYRGSADGDIDETTERATFA